MTEDQKTSSEANNNQQIRHDLVNTAVNFLLNPSVINKPYEHKTAFLRKKGLTEAEISLAYEKAESDPNYKQIQQSSDVSNISPALPPPVPFYRPVTFWSKLSRLSSSLIVIAVALFGVHYVYKNYIEPLIFGEDRESKSQKLEKQLLEMANSLGQLEKHVASLEECMNVQREQVNKFIQNEVNEYYPTPLALRDLKSEMASVKSLLLNRHQFPALPKVSPTIPHWQLPSNENKDDSSSEHEHLHEDKNSSKPNDVPEVCNNDVANQSNGTKGTLCEDVNGVQYDQCETLSTDVSLMQ